MPFLFWIFDLKSPPKPQVLTVWSLSTRKLWVHPKVRSNTVLLEYALWLHCNLQYHIKTSNAGRCLFRDSGIFESFFGRRNSKWSQCSISNLQFVSFFSMFSCFSHRIFLRDGLVLTNYVLQWRSTGSKEQTSTLNRRSIDSKVDNAVLTPLVPRQSTSRFLKRQGS